MNKELADVQEALEDAHQVSERSGKWSTVSEVKTFDMKASLKTLRALVKDGAASEKVVKGEPMKLFKPTRAGSGAGPVLGEDKEKPPREEPDGKTPGRKRPHGKKPGKHGKRPDRKDPPRRRDPHKNPPKKDPRRDRPPRKPPKKPDGDPADRERQNKIEQDRANRRTRQNLGDTIGAGVATMLVGGISGSIGSTGTTAGTAAKTSVPTNYRLM